MYISIVEVLCLIMCCIFGIFAFIFFASPKTNLKSFWISVHSIFCCIMTLNYAFLLMTTNLTIKTSLLNVHMIFVGMLCFSICDFILIINDQEKRRRQRIVPLIFILIYFALYYIYPISSVIDVTKKIDWHNAILKIIQLPSISFFIICLFLIIFLLARRLASYYKSSYNSKRHRISSYILGMVLVFTFLINIFDLAIKYLFHVKSFYYDLSVLIAFIFLLAVVLCQKFFYILEIATNELIYKMIDRIPESVGVFDYKLRLVWCNKNFRKMFFSNDWKLKHPQIKNLILSDQDEEIFKTKVKIQTRIQVGDNVQDVLFTSLPIYSRSNDFTSAVYYIQDMTEFEEKKRSLKENKKNLELKIINKTIALKKLNLKLKKLIKEKTAQEEKNFYILNFDLTTGLYNRKSIIQKLKSLISNKQKLYLVYFDIDDVKMLNDTIGYSIVDTLLNKVAKRIQTLNYEKSIARFGSDEFLIILDGNENVDKACKDIQKLLSKPFRIDGNEIKITVSIGVSIYPNDGVDVTNLIRFADMAMYESKEKGKNCISFFDSKLKSKVEIEFFMSEQVKSDLLNGRMRLLVEPVVYLNQNGKRSICAFETVSRWYYNFDNILSESVFIEITRRAGILKKYDRWLLATSIKRVSKNAFFKDNPDLKLMITLSDQSFYNPVFFDYVVENVSSCNVSPKQLEIEITERTLMLDPKLAIKNIKQFQQFGIDITIKNFGVSYSSLSLMNKLDFSKIKISKIFISEIGKNAKDEGIIRLLILLAKRIDIKISAEGVETPEQLRFLIKNACHFFQGDYFARPLLLEDFLKLLESNLIHI